MDSLISIKQLSKDDIVIVHQLAKDIWPDAFKDILATEQIDYMLEWMYNINTLTEQVQIGHLYYMVTQDGVPKGFVGLEPNFPDAGTLRIHKLYVKTGDQGAGLGSALLEKSIEIAKEMDFATINLNVNRFNAAVDFYKHKGFQIVKEENIDIGKGYLMEDYVMAIAL
ncbi:MAG: ribosomal protein S18 acetylase RimI-like enzyme [Flavobacteriaceae bacterium]|jgi:ribosomal protein S18 acetylase RimI-like enzyme